MSKIMTLFFFKKTPDFITIIPCFEKAFADGRTKNYFIVNKKNPFDGICGYVDAVHIHPNFPAPQMLGPQAVFGAPRSLCSLENRHNFAALR